MGKTSSSTMGRLHSKGKGIARRSLPYKRTAPSWVKQSAGECVKEICAMAKKGFTPSQIGVVLRDSHGIPQVKMVAGNKIVRILRSQGKMIQSCLQRSDSFPRTGLAPSLPEDLYCLIKKAVSVRKHLEKNRKDKDSKFRLILIESRIHRLARYYKLSKRIAGNWRYESANAAALLV